MYTYTFYRKSYEKSGKADAANSNPHWSKYDIVGVEWGRRGWDGGRWRRRGWNEDTRCVRGGGMRMINMAGSGPTALLSTPPTSNLETYPPLNRHFVTADSHLSPPLQYPPPTTLPGLFSKKTPPPFHPSLDYTPTLLLAHSQSSFSFLTRGESPPPLPSSPLKYLQVKQTAKTT